MRTYNGEDKMKRTLKATVTLTQEYEADSKNYNNCEFVEDMIDIDIGNFDDDPIIFIEGMLEKGITKITIEDITDKEKSIPTRT